MEYRLKSCPFCKKQIIATAERCQHCGEWLNGQAKKNTHETSQLKKPLSEKPLGYFLATAGGLLGGPIGLLVSPYVLLLLNRTFKSKHGKQPNRFLVWSLIGVAAAPICWLPIVPSTPPKTASQQPGDKKEQLLAENGPNIQALPRSRPISPVLAYKAASAINYSIREDSEYSWHGNPNEKRGVRVELSNKATEESLKEIARQIRDGAQRPYKLTVIYFYLPKEDGDQKGNAWAIYWSNENAVQFIGLTTQEMSALYKTATKYLVKTNATQTWLETRVPPGQIKELVERRDRSMGMRSLTPGYSSSEEEAIGSEGKDVILIKEARGIKIRDKESNELGEYYIINPKGDLEYWSRDGHYFTAKNVKNIPR